MVGRRCEVRYPRCTSGIHEHQVGKPHARRTYVYRDDRPVVKMTVRIDFHVSGPRPDLYHMSTDLGQARVGRILPYPSARIA